MLRLIVGVQGRLLQAWSDQASALRTEWEEAASVNDYALRLCPDQAQALQREQFAVLDRWAHEHPTDVPAEGSLAVSVLLDVLPLEHWPT